MTEFHQYIDTIYVRTDSGTYKDTTTNFEIDAGMRLPELPRGAIERIYVPGVRHAINGREATLDGGPLPWDIGDAAIAAIAELLAAKEVREAPPSPPPPPPPRPIVVTPAQAKLALVDAGLYANIRQACISHPSVAVQIFWESATRWEENHPIIQAMAAELRLSNETVHNLFVAASLK
jgi:hypothetical protein